MSGLLANPWSDDVRIVQCGHCCGRVTIAIIAAVIMATSPAQAQVEIPGDERQPVDFAGLDIQVSVGLGGFVDQSGPVPISFLMSNNSVTDLDGRFVVTDSVTGRTIELGDVFIGAGSVRRFSSIQAIPEWFDCVATYEDDQRTLWRRPLSINLDVTQDANYLMFIDDGGRALQWPNDPELVIDGDRYVPKPGEGRLVQPLTAKSWQVPQHPGPLTAIQGIVFSDTTDPDMLNDAQWQAVARWLCLGGTIFLHQESHELVARIQAAAPLTLQPAVAGDPFSIRRCGSGSIREYAAPLFSADDPSTLKHLAVAASHLSRYQAVAAANSIRRTWNYYRSDVRNSESTRLWVLSLFGIYGLLAGVVTLALFRLSRRGVAIWIISVVGLTSVLAVLLGIKLSHSPGDLEWSSLTVGGSGGTVQLAKLEVHSAGGRDSTVAAKGRNIDMQLIDSAHSDSSLERYYYRQSDNPEVGYPAFTWQPNLLVKETDAWQSSVPITPWGQRQLNAVAFDPNMRGLEVRLTCVPEHAARPAAADEQYEPLRVQVTNHLPFDLQNYQLLVVRSNVNFTSNGSQPNGIPGIAAGWSTPGPGAPTDLSESLQSCSFGDLSAGSAVDQELILTQWPAASQNYGESWLFDNAMPAPDVAWPGAISVWIVGRISQSSVLSIDKDRCDYVPADAGLHVFVQPIPEEDLPPDLLARHRHRLNQNLEAAREAERGTGAGAAQ